MKTALGRLVWVIALIALTTLAHAAEGQAGGKPRVLVTGRGPGPGAIEEMWRPLVDDLGMEIVPAFTVHVNSYYADNGGEAYAGALPKEQERLMIEQLAPGEGRRPVDLAIIGGRVIASPDQYSQFDRVKETWHPGTLTPALQEALVKYVKAGGKLVFSTRQIFTDTRASAKFSYAWKGGPLDEILPAEDLKENLPFMDGCPREEWGRIAFRQVGEGKVVIVDPHTPSPTVAATRRREFELWGALASWMLHGNAAFPVTVSAEVPSKAVAGAPLTVKAVLRNYECGERVFLRINVSDADGTQRFTREVPVELPRGQSREEIIEAPITNTWLTGRHMVLAQALIGRGRRPAASLSKFVDVTGAFDLSVTTDRDGYGTPGGKAQPGQSADTPIRVAVDISMNTEKREARRVQFSAALRDTWGRTLQAESRDLDLEPVARQAASLAFIMMKDYPRGTYWIDASLASGKETWARSATPVQRYGTYKPDDDIVWTMWTGDHSKQWLDLYRDTGLNAICDDFAAAERHGFKVWTRAQYCLSLAEAIPAADLAARFRALYAKPLAGRRDPSVWHPALTQVCQDGENGWPILLKGAAQKAPFSEWLKRRYPSLDVLNAAWGKGYKSWDEIECAEPTSGYGVSAPRGAANTIPWSDQNRWIQEQGFDYHRVWSQALHDATPWGVLTSATACAWSHNAGTDVIDLQCAQPWYLTTDWYWQATRGRALFGNQHGRSTHWAFIANRPVLSTAFWNAIAAGSRFVDMWTPVFPERTRYPSWDGTFNIYRPSCKHSPASLDIKALIEQISRKQRVLLDSHAVVSRDVAYYEASRGAAAEFGLFGHLFHSGFLPDLASGPKADLSKFKVVLASGAGCVSTDDARLLKDYAAAGGVLVTFPGFAAADEHGKAFPAAPGLGLDEVLGCRLSPAGKPEGRIVTKGPHPALAPMPRTSMAVWADAGSQGTVSALAEGTIVLAEYEQSRGPALTLHPFGKGWAVHVNFGTACGPAYAGQSRFVNRDENWEELRRLIEGLLAWAKASRPLVVLDSEGRGVPQVNASLLATDDGSVSYAVACCDYRQEHSLALDRATFNGAAGRIELRAADAAENKGTRIDGEALILESKDAFAEYPIKTSAGRYQVWLDVYFDRQAARQQPQDAKQPNDGNALIVSIDGKNDPPDNAAGPERTVFGNTPITDRWIWQSGRWFDLERGKHTLRLAAAGWPVRVRSILLITPPALGTRLYLAAWPQFVFDVYAEKELTPKDDERGCYVDLPLQPGEGKVIALLAQRPGRLSVSAPKTAKAGDLLKVAVAKTPPDGRSAQRDTHSVRLTFAGPDGREIHALRREFPLQESREVAVWTALSDPKGKWIIEAEDQTTGRRASAGCRIE